MIRIQITGGKRYGFMIETAYIYLAIPPPERNTNKVVTR